MKPYSEITVNDEFANAVNTLSEDIVVDDMNQAQESVFNEINSDLAAQLVSLKSVLHLPKPHQASKLM